MTPTPNEIKVARHVAGLSPAIAAELIYSRPDNWNSWEAGMEAMHPGLFELFLIKTGQVNGA